MAADPAADRSAVLRASLLGVAIATLLLTIQVVGHIGVELTDEPFVARFADADGPLEAIMARSDGQAFAQVATDPLLREPEQFGPEPTGSSELAYRAQRPLGSYLSWAFALGQRNAIPEATVIVTLAGCALLVSLVAGELRRRGIDARYAVGALLVPGVFSSFRWLMPGALAAGLALAGVALWHHTRHDPTRRDRWITPAALLCFAAAALTRETMLVVPVGLLIGDLWRHRRLRPRPLLLLAPAAVYAAWWAAVRVRLGLPVTHTGQADIRRDTPLQGLLDAMKEWSVAEPEWYLLVGTAALAIAAVRRRPGPEILAILVLGLGVASTMSFWVWRDWTDWSRALVPVHLAAVAALLPTRGPRPEPNATAPSTSSQEVASAVGSPHDPRVTRRRAHIVR